MKFYLKCFGYFHEIKLLSGGRPIGIHEKFCKHTGVYPPEPSCPENMCPLPLPGNSPDSKATSKTQTLQTWKIHGKKSEIHRITCHLGTQINLC